MQGPGHALKAGMNLAIEIFKGAETPFRTVDFTTASCSPGRTEGPGP
jgi:hypothetical protein